MKRKKALILDLQGSLKERVEVRTKAAEELKDVVLGKISKESRKWDPP
jgi:hypothetical protein